MQESHLYEGIKLWAISQEMALTMDSASRDLTSMLMPMFQQIRFNLCSPSEMVAILRDPWLVEVRQISFSALLPVIPMDFPFFDTQRAR